MLGIGGWKVESAEGRGRSPDIAVPRWYWAKKKYDSKKANARMVRLGVSDLTDILAACDEKDQLVRYILNKLKVDGTLLRGELNALADSAIVLNNDLYAKILPSVINTLVYFAENKSIEESELNSIVRLLSTLAAHAQSYANISIPDALHLFQKIAACEVIGSVPLNLFSLAVTLRLDVSLLHDRLLGKDVGKEPGKDKTAGSNVALAVSDCFSNEQIETAVFRFGTLDGGARLRTHLHALFKDVEVHAPPSLDAVADLTFLSDLPMKAKAFMKKLLVCLFEVTENEEWVSMQFFCRHWIKLYKGSFVSSAEEAGLADIPLFGGSTAAKVLKALNGKLILTLQKKSLMLKRINDLNMETFESKLV